MIKIRPVIIVFALALVACGGSDESTLTVAKGGMEYGGVFKWNETGALRSIYPPNMTQAAAHRVVGPVYQGLVKFSEDELSIEPCLAESWKISEEGRVFEFKLRDGVRFHDDPCFLNGVGRELSASDVVWCFEQLCRQSSKNQMFWLFQDRVLGANTAYSASVKDPDYSSGVRGLTIVDAQTIRIELTAPFPAFLGILAHQGCWIYPREFVEHYGESGIDLHAVGTGPFKMRVYKPSDVLLLERNSNYWERDEHGNHLPFLDVVKVNFESKKQKELEQFLAGNLSIVQEVPVANQNLLTEPFESKSYFPRSMTSLTAQFYCFNVNKAPFDDRRVRRAIAMAIDKQYIADSILYGLALPANHGIVPPFFNDYPAVEGLEYNPEEGRRLLAEAGYPNGEGFPVLNILFSGNGVGYVEVVNAIQTMLNKNLNIRVPISTLPAGQYYDKVENGKASFWREGWLADHPDPENFLAMFYGKNAPDDPNERTYLNTSRFKDAVYDSLLQKANLTIDAAERMKSYALADQRFVDECPAVPIYFTKATLLTQKEVQGLSLNGLESIELTRVWIKSAEEEVQ